MFYNILSIALKYTFNNISLLHISNEHNKFVTE